MKARSVKEISAMRATDISASQWMQEICLQLAALNEAFALPGPIENSDIPLFAEVPAKRKPGRSPKQVN